MLTPRSARSSPKTSKIVAGTSSTPSRAFRWSDNSITPFRPPPSSACLAETTVCLRPVDARRRIAYPSEEKELPRGDTIRREIGKNSPAEH
jgi:hypothetical protein